MGESVGSGVISGVGVGCAEEVGGALVGAGVGLGRKLGLGVRVDRLVGCGSRPV